MEFSRFDTDVERDLKLQVISIYNEKLDGRAKRKKFIADHKLLDTKRYEEMDRKRSLDERNLVQRMRLFARFQTPEEHEKFVDTVIQTKRMRKEIAQLQFYRRMGIRSTAEAEKYELDKSRREYHRIEAMKDKKNSGVIKSALSSLLPQYTSNKSGLLDEHGNARDEENLSVGQNGLPTDTTAEVSTEKAEMSYATAPLSKATIDEFDLSNAPGLDLLTSKEIFLCKKLQLLPEFYLQIKRSLIQESLLQGFVEERESKSIIKVDVVQRQGIVEFMLSSGWIKVKN